MDEEYRMNIECLWFSCFKWDKCPRERNRPCYCLTVSALIVPSQSYPSFDGHCQTCRWIECFQIAAPTGKCHVTWDNDVSAIEGKEELINDRRVSPDTKVWISADRGQLIRRGPWARFSAMPLAMCAMLKGLLRVRSFSWEISGLSVCESGHSCGSWDVLTMSVLLEMIRVNCFWVFCNW